MNPPSRTFHFGNEPAFIDSELESAVQKVTWYHTIGLPDGTVTDGVNASADTLKQLDALGLPLDCRDLDVLDIGCRDGFFSFEMERRGANVVAIDYMHPQHTGFPVAARALRSQVPFRIANVYELEPETYGSFDVVLFLGVLYHLRNPLLALDRIRSVCKSGAKLFVESEVASSKDIADSAAPAWQFFPGTSHNDDASNMWAPNEPGLRAVLEEAEFEVRDLQFGQRRCVGLATARDDHHVAYFRRLDSGHVPSD